MPCESYREALTEAAATNAAPSRELHSHLEACASCRTAFTEEQQLFDAIDTGLRATVSTVVPASLLPRVRAKLMEQPRSRRVLILAFAGFGIAAALVVAFSLARKPVRNGAGTNPQAVSAAHNVQPAVNQAATPAIAPVEIVGTARKPTPVAAVKASPTGEAVSGELEVLIPAGQKRATDTLLAQLLQGKVHADVLLAEKPEQPLDTLEVSPLNISPVEIKPLPELETNSATSDEKTRF